MYMRGVYVYTYHERCSRGLASARAWSVGKDIVCNGQLEACLVGSGLKEKFKIDICLLLAVLESLTEIGVLTMVGAD